ncbi:MAG: hypothetical protein RR618_00900 [Cellulosilyticaceae bacterium]
MSKPRFMVLKLRDLKLPGIVLLVAIAAFAFFMMRGNGDAAETFSPADTYEDGKYIASITLSDAVMDLVVDVKDNMISSIALNGFDENERTVYGALNDSISFVNDYVTSTQSLELPETDNISYSTSLLMDAVRVALSDNDDETITTTYQAPLLENLSADTNVVTDPQTEVSEEAASTEVTVEAVTDEATVETTDEVVATEEVVPEN